MTASKVCLVFEFADFYVFELPAQDPINEGNTATRVERRSMKAEIAPPTSVQREPRLKEHHQTEVDRFERLKLQKWLKRLL